MLFGDVTPKADDGINNWDAVKRDAMAALPTDEACVKIDKEIRRLELIRESERLAGLNFLPCLNSIVECAKGQGAADAASVEEKHQDWTEYYKAVDKFIAQKLRFWGQSKNGLFDADMLDKLQEYGSEFLELSWKRYGMKKHKEQSKNAMAEFEMFKAVCAANPKKGKRTRRGGKKHKKKKEKGD